MIMKTDEDNLPLFRETAVSAFANRSYGRPIAAMPKTWSYFSIMLVGMVIVGGWFLATSTYSRKESVVGSLEPEDGLVRLSVSQSGLVEQVLFGQGDKIIKGETLFVLSQDRKLVAGLGTSAELIGKLNQERNEFLSQIEIETNSSRADVENARLQVEQLELEKIEVQGQIRQQEESVSIQSKIYERYANLAKAETVTFLELNNQKEKYVSYKQNLAALRQRRAALNRELIQAQFVLKTRPLDSERVKSELSRRLIEISNRETEITSRGSQAIHAPISGTIETLEVQAGNMIYPQQMIASILAEDAELFAEVYIPSRAIGFIMPKQSVRIMYSAFPHQRFGAAKGEVLEVSNSILRPEEIPSGFGLEEPAYKVRIQLDAQSMSGFGEVLPLRPGMALRAEIILEERSFLQWVLEPLRAKRSA